VLVATDKSRATNIAFKNGANSSTIKKTVIAARKIRKYTGFKIDSLRHQVFGFLGKLI
jgi:hypothetical protein